MMVVLRRCRRPGQRPADGRGRRDRDPRAQRGEGLLDRPEATAEAIDGAGWFKTSDIGKVDEDGYFFIVDRKKDLIIRGGYNVYPRQIEEVLYEHPAVREVAVVGMPHPELGEEVGAAVALKKGPTASPEELQSFVKEQVAAYEYLNGSQGRQPAGGQAPRSKMQLMSPRGRAALGAIMPAKPARNSCSPAA
jgi:hypothetical protein